MLRQMILGLFRGGNMEALPQRVQRSVRDLGEVGEILVSLVQLLVVVTFGVLYLVTPKGFTSDAPFEPVPYALGGYLAFTLLRLALAWRRYLPTAFRYLSVVIDVTLLLVLIWSFHIQYGQPAAFVLKSPTLLYVFIFIALRALLFDPAYVVATGLTATVGWLVMVGYVIAQDPSGETITRDYAVYLTSNSVLLGAEFDKIISILIVTALIAVAMMRGRNLLVQAVGEGARARDLSRFFESAVADQIVHAEAEITAGHGEMRDAAILYVDIRGFTKMSLEMTPNALIGLMTEYQERLEPVIHKYNGTTEKYLGDGMMAAFGAAVRSDVYAMSALCAVDEMVVATDQWNKERAEKGLEAIRIGISVSAGPVVFGAIGGDERLEFAVVGHQVNLAAKLEKHTKTLGVRALCTETAYQLAVAQGYDPKAGHEHLSASVVEGVDDPEDLVILSRYEAA